MESQSLTFSTLEQRIEALPEHPSYRISPSRRTRWGNGVGMAAGLLGLLVGKLAPNSHSARLAMIVLLAIEIGAFLIAWTAELPTLNLRPSRERSEFADTLDFDMPHHEELITWLRCFPPGRLEAMSNYANHRLERLRSKLPLLTGGLDKLGILPIATALFLQFKDAHWPPHPSWAEVILIGALMLVYGLSLLQLSLRFRLELYDTLLKKALAS